MKPPPPSSRKAGRKADRIVRKRLADGSLAEYRYPPHKPPVDRYGPDSLHSLILAYQRSPEWAALAKATRGGYAIYLRDLDAAGATKAADFTRRDILTLRDAIAAGRGNGAATGFIRAASAAFTWAVDREWLTASPVVRIKPLPRGTLPAWRAGHVALALAHLSDHLARAIKLALHTGQRRGDLVAMTWAAYDGALIRLKQQKTGAVLALPIVPTFAAELAAWKREAKTLTILADANGLPWTAQHLTEQLAWHLAKIEGFPPGMGIHGLRKLAATNLAEAGCSAHEIAAITGHRSLQMVAHYTASADQITMAQQAVARLGTNADKRDKFKK